MVNVTWLVVGIALLLIAIGLAVWAGFIYRQAQIDATNSAVQLHLPTTFYILVGVALLLFIGALVAIGFSFYYSPAVVATTPMIAATPTIITSTPNPCLTPYGV